MQVVAGWLKPRAIRKVWVISDAAMNDPVQSELLKLAATESVSVMFMTVRGALELLEAGKQESEKLMILVPSPQEILSLVKNGVKLEWVNVGGLHDPDCR